MQKQNYFYKVSEHSCVASVCENKQPLIFYDLKKS